MLKAKTRLTCICGKVFYRYKQRKGQVYACSHKCRRQLLERTGFHCSACDKRLPRKAFKWYADSRYAAGERRAPYCLSCTPKKLQSWRDTHKVEMKEQHASWRLRSLAKGGDVALRFYFARQMSGYRSRSRELGVSCNLDPDYLVQLFHEHNGRCYYTHESLVWDNFGKKKSSPKSMSVDRLNPGKGYVKGNVVLCSMHVNGAKGGLNETEFYTFCERVLAVRAEKQAQRA